MNVILLSGGSGTRLWPLSNDVRSKQFLRIIKREDGTRESMAQRMYRMIKTADSDAGITVATSANQVSAIRSQLGNDVRISVEPCRMDTFPAIALACAFLRKNGVSGDEPVVVCPVDSYVSEDYFACLKRLAEAAGKGESSLVLMGIEPASPSTRFGYIIPENCGEISFVREFREKPDEETAEKYIAEGALWNSGIFAFKLGYVLGIAEREFGLMDYDVLCRNYVGLRRITFDYAVVEKESSIQVLRFHGQWDDLETWDALTSVLDEYTAGNVTAVDCPDTHIINESPVPLIAMGLHDAVVVACSDGILVADKQSSRALKNYVAAARPMFERRDWGEYKVLDHGRTDGEEEYLVKDLRINSGKHISYQYHEHRSEFWNIVDGSGKLILDGVVTDVRKGDSVSIKPMQKHAILADTPLHIIEVQTGDMLIEEDIIRLEWNWV